MRQNVSERHAQIIQIVMNAIQKENVLNVIEVTFYMTRNALINVRKDTELIEQNGNAFQKKYMLGIGYTHQKVHVKEDVKEWENMENAHALMNVFKKVIVVLIMILIVEI